MSALSSLAISVLVGGGLGAGLLCIIGSLPSWSAASLSVRIAPYVRDVVDDAELPPGALPRIGVLPAARLPLWTRMRVLVERTMGGGDALKRRLAQAGLDVAPSTFRARQLGWTVAGIGLGAATVIVLVLLGRMTPPAALLPLLVGTGAAVGCEMRLTARTAARRTRLADELPTTLEFLALCLSAGEGFLESLRRIAGVGSGELTAELRGVVLAVSTGSPLADALGEMASRLQLPGLTRATEQVIAALEHGAPLSGVLHAQAGDAREDAKRVLIEQAGRKEILMLLPVNRELVCIYERRHLRPNLTGSARRRARRRPPDHRLQG
ncbi:type II secretion system F family protein [Microbacterium sp. H83]|uniref:type II secretion system F family protein n=1 Tax=Microbacterium sp. H83 TaxID=1827324 RepID=UPI00082AB523|nr:type II secretion system F family protein [Microbacterium sp. H83]